LQSLAEDRALRILTYWELNKVCVVLDTHYIHTHSMCTTRMSRIPRPPPLLIITAHDTQLYSWRYRGQVPVRAILLTGLLAAPFLFLPSIELIARATGQSVSISRGGAR
jgi:hypothetical protein